MSYQLPNFSVSDSSSFPASQKIVSDVEKIYMKIIDSTVEKCKMFQNPRIMDALRTRWIEALRARLNSSKNAKSTPKFLNFDDVVKTSSAENMKVSWDEDKPLFDASDATGNIKRPLKDENCPATKKTKIIDEVVTENQAEMKNENELQKNKDEDQSIQLISECTEVVENSVEAKELHKNDNSNEEDDEFDDADVDEDKPNESVKSENVEAHKEMKSEGRLTWVESKEENLVKLSTRNQTLEEDDDVGTILDDVKHVSDLDDPDLSDLEDEEPQTNDFIVAQFEKVSRPSSKKQGSNANWKVDLRAGIIQLEGQEIIFDKLVGEFVF